MPLSATQLPLDPKDQDRVASSCVELSGGAAFCRLCGAGFPATAAKAVAQHLKSKPHKMAAKGGSNPVAKGPRDPERERRAQEAETAAADAQLWDILGISGCFCTSAPYPRALLCRGSSGALQPVHPPPLVGRPKAADLSRPFLTLQSASIAEVPLHLEQALELLCRPGAARLPNVDVGSHNMCIKSWSQAARALQAADAQGQPYWASFEADIVHPPWWPRAGHVPTYNNVIVGRGSCSIGLHIDVDNFKGTREPVCTYLTAVAGRKRVLLLPPHQTLLPLETRDDFPHEPTAEQWAAFLEAGGYYFDLAPSPSDAHDERDTGMGPGTAVTLFMPRGWCHWLVGATDWHVVYSGSFKPGAR